MNEKIEYGFVDFNGNQWSNVSVDTYNRFNAEVAKRDNLPYDDRSSLAFKELEFYKDQRHKNFVQLMDITANKIREGTAPKITKEFIAP